MSSISIRWEKRAIKEFARLERQDQQRVVTAVEGLRSNPLEGRPLTAELKGLRRLRVGPYRVIYGFDGSDLLVFAFGSGTGRTCIGEVDWSPFLARHRRRTSSILMLGGVR